MKPRLLYVTRPPGHRAGDGYVFREQRAPRDRRQRPFLPPLPRDTRRNSASDAIEVCYQSRERQDKQPDEPIALAPTSGPALSPAASRKALVPEPYQRHVTVPLQAYPYPYSHGPRDLDRRAVSAADQPRTCS